MKRRIIPIIIIAFWVILVVALILYFKPFEKNELQQQEIYSEDLADEYLYQIRHRANSSNTKITATLDLVKKERRKELVMEGHRLYDILRVGDTVERKGGSHFLNGEDLIKVDWNDYRTIMPIPQAEIDANPKMIQNPSYK